MIDLREFYKDYYDQTLTRKIEINNSLSVLVGILTALIAALFYALTNFDFHSNSYLSVIFVVLSFVATFLIGCSIYYLMMSFSDFHGGYNYAYLESADLLNQYYERLIQHYSMFSVHVEEDRIEQAKDKFSVYVTQLLINAAIINTANNEMKDFQRYRCHKAIISTVIALSLLSIPFYINFIFKK